MAADTIDLSQGKKSGKKPVSSSSNPMTQRKSDGPSPKMTNGKPGGKQGFFARAKETIKNNRALQVVLIFVGIFLIAGLTYAAQQLFFNNKPLDVVEIEEEKIEAVVDMGNPLERRTDGVLVDSELEANKYPVAIMIENLSSVRPQSGLSVANIVYETLAEGGITRFMAIFAGDAAKEIHPVRSARPYYLEWVQEYKALYGHAGGSPQALEAISGLGVHDLNALSNDGKYFWRGPGSAPHNLYTSTTLIERAVRDKGLLEEEADFEPWLFADAKSSSDRPDEEKRIELDFSNGNYNVRYTYDHENNCYKRYHVATEHIDREDGEQLCPTNVVVQIVPPEISAGEKGRIALDVTGEGDVIVFNNGEVAKGTWKKEDRDARTKFLDEEGNEIPLARGQVWIEVIPNDKRVVYDE
ncbi:DUF3048 domain-containing protein [Patescibacteria group bacterium]|nr:DUF3048 domain-containing protein [Patescibacteria group bacterium]